MGYIYNAPNNTGIAAAAAVALKLDTTLEAAGGGDYQYTVQALENAPGGGGGGSATLENQEIIIGILNTGEVAVTVVSPNVSATLVEIVSGDSYMDADGRALTWLGRGLWPDLTDATITLHVYHPTTYLELLTVDGDVVHPTGANQQVNVELEDTDTALLTPGRYGYGLRAVLDDDSVVTLALAPAGFAVARGMGITTTTTTTSTTTTTTTTAAP